MTAWTVILLGIAFYLVLLAGIFTAALLGAAKGN